MKDIAHQIQLIFMSFLFNVLVGCAVITNPSLTLHAKVIDQHGAPVPDVDIEYHVSINSIIAAPMVAGYDVDGYQTKTDREGRFDAHHFASSLWTVRMEQPKYLFARGLSDYANKTMRLPLNSVYPEGGMSRDNPVIIPAWKRENATALNTAAVATYVPNNELRRVKLGGSPFELELLWNTPGSSKEPGAWSLRIRVINGEIQAMDEVFPYEAPTSGYLEEWVGGGIDSPNTVVHELRKKFYLKDRGGKTYGRLSTYMQPYFRDKNNVDVTYWINPNGERSLLNNTASGD